MPSLRISPWIFGAPQRGLDLAICQMSFLTSCETSPLAGPRARDFHRQNKRKPVRCHRTTVSGLTTTSTSAQRDQSRERTSQKARSLLRRRGRPEVRWKLASCWRRARFSIARSARLRRAERNAPRRLRNRNPSCDYARWRAVPTKPAPHRRHRRKTHVADDILANHKGQAGPAHEGRPGGMRNVPHSNVPHS